MSYIPRTAVAAILSTALLVAAVPAQARSTERHQAAKPAVSWFDAALSWLSDFVVGTQHSAQTRPSPTVKTTYPIGGVGGTGTGGMHPMCSPNVDPLGHCGGGGTGG